MWVARDEDDALVLFDEKPKRDKWFGFWCEGENIPYHGNDEQTCAEWRAQRFELYEDKYEQMFQNLEWEDEPIEVDIFSNDFIQEYGDACYKQGEIDANHFEHGEELEYNLAFCNYVDSKK